LLAGSELGAERAAMFYSFFATYKKDEVDPFDWLMKALEIITEHKVSNYTNSFPRT